MFNFFETVSLVVLLSLLLLLLC